jgi:tetratricopeptide (TPR) repeat protein
MPRLYWPRLVFNRFEPLNLVNIALLLVSLNLVSLNGVGQQPADLASLHGVVRDADGRPVAQTAILLHRKSSADSLNSQTDSQGNYSFQGLSDGMYSLRGSKTGYADTEISSVFLRPHESKTVDLTLGLVQQGQGPATSSPQFFDQPQFTVAGVTDTTNLGGHGSDTVVRTRNSLAKDTVSLGETTVKASFDAEREKSLRALAERQPVDFGANHQLGQLLIASGKAREAIPFLERAAAKEPGNYENAYDLALANAQAGNYAIARDEAAKLLATHDQANLHHLLGDVHEKLGDSLEAVRHYQRAAELDPSESNLFDWGAELLLHHAPEPAVEVFSKGNRLYPGSARMLLGLGAAYFARGAYDEAIQRVCSASDLNPNDPVPYLFLGEIEQAQTVPSNELVEKLRRFLTLQPENADANYYYAVGLWKRRNAAPEKHNVARVESLLKTAIQINPKHAAAALQLGIVHSEQGAYSEAISDYRKALDYDPQMEEAHYRMAQAYRQTGDSEKAKEELRLYGQLAKESAQMQDRERHEIKQFVYTLRDQSAPQVQ